MARRGVKREVARRIVSLAERQHGVIAVWQLPELGLTWEQVRGRVRAGWLRRLHAGVYAVAGRPLSQRGRWLGAVLACGRGAVLSHNDAAMLWRLLRPTEGPVHVSVPAEGGRGPRPGIKIHRRRGLSTTDTTVRAAIPLTTPARTILDLATVIGRRPLERAIDEAERLRLCGGDDLAVLVERHRGRAGTALVADVLDSHQAGSTVTRSELESGSCPSAASGDSHNRWSTPRCSASPSTSSGPPRSSPKSTGPRAT